MKSLLNRRSAVLASTPSHLVDVEHVSLTPAQDGIPRDEADAAAAQLAQDATVDADDPRDGRLARVDRAPATVEAPRPVTTLRAVPVVPTQVNGRSGVLSADTAEVDDLCAHEELAPFRVFRSFAYSASLLFHPRDLCYYIALYHDNTLWRALKALDLESAETAFHHFEEQATRLSDGETRRAQLEAQNDQLAKMIAASEAQSERMRAHLQRTTAQEQSVANRQHQLRKEVSQLEAQRVAAQAHLNKAHRQLHQLNIVNNENLPHLPSNR
ncbi:DUF2968 domain-containing protein [Paraburkholderia phosphatilytica]|uniref:DUF2968 domain-containing protein n=1 Tax=Paraburkholderia phosphatilytica TaxID=2282883 RepID=UPI000E482D3F|nr:DUF2968 domain-containing protein [Paraburkholderia phosphatilytica]